MYAYEHQHTDTHVYINVRAYVRIEQNISADKRSETWLLSLETYADEPEAIVGGNNAMGGQFPYQISLQYYGQHICGGSIISSTQILTAAHCVEDVSFLNRLVRT